MKRIALFGIAIVAMLPSCSNNYCDVLETQQKVECYHLEKLVARFFETDNIVACNWGWGAGWNGYFLADVLTPGDDISFDKGSDDDKPIQKGHYHLDIRIIPNIKH